MPPWAMVEQSTNTDRFQSATGFMANSGGPGDEGLLFLLYASFFYSFFNPPHQRLEFHFFYFHFLASCFLFFWVQNFSLSLTIGFAVLWLVSRNTQIMFTSICT